MELNECEREYSVLHKCIKLSQQVDIVLYIHLQLMSHYSSLFPIFIYVRSNMTNKTKLNTDRRDLLGNKRSMYTLCFCDS